MKRVTVFVLVCFLTLSGVSFAKGPGAWTGFRLLQGKWWHVPEIAEKLGVTTDEKAKLDELALERKRELIDLKSAVQRQELELEAILDQADFDATACKDQFGKLLEARQEVATERFGFHVEVRELLGLDRYRELRTMLRDRHKDSRKGRPGHKGPVTEEMTCR